MLLRGFRQVMKTVCIGGIAALTIATNAIAGGSIKDAPVYTDRVHPTLSWSGLYVGVTAGGGWGESRFNDGAVSNPFDIDGAVVGGTLGYNFMASPNLLLGVEADVSWSGINGAFGPGNLGQPGGAGWGCGSGPCRTDVGWFGTLRGRVGFVSGSWMFYGTGGLAFGHVKSGIDNTTNFQASDTNFGWTAGLGTELALSRNVTAKLEYLHVDLGYTDLSNGFFKADAKFDVVRAGLNIKLGN